MHNQRNVCFIISSCSEKRIAIPINQKMYSDGPFSSEVQEYFNVLVNSDESLRISGVI